MCMFYGISFMCNILGWCVILWLAYKLFTVKCEKRLFSCTEICHVLLRSKHTILNKYSATLLFYTFIWELHSDTPPPPHHHYHYHHHHHHHRFLLWLIPYVMHKSSHTFIIHAIPAIPKCFGCAEYLMSLQGRYSQVTLNHGNWYS